MVNIKSPSLNFLSSSALWPFKVEDQPSVAVVCRWEAARLWVVLLLRGVSPHLSSAAAPGAADICQQEPSARCASPLPPPRLFKRPDNQRGGEGQSRHTSPPEHPAAGPPLTLGARPGEMAKSSPRKSLKNLFSRSEANLSAPPPAEKDADSNAGEKKKFKFLKFKTKSKGSSAPEKPANESQQVARYAPESSSSR